MGRSILMGVHNLTTATAFMSCLKEDGYEVDYVDDLHVMVESAKTVEYLAYIMDANLSSPGFATSEPAEQVWALVRERVEKGLAKFVAVSGTPRAVESAREHGIPAEDTLNFSMKLHEFVDSLNEIHS
jgi:hypothetical protein